MGDLERFLVSAVAFLIGFLLGLTSTFRLVGRWHRSAYAERREALERKAAELECDPTFRAWLREKEDGL